MSRLLALLLLLGTATAWGQIAAPGVTVAQLEAAEQQVASSLAEDDPQRTSLQRMYTDTRAALSAFEQSVERHRNFVQSRANARSEAEVLREQLARYQSPTEEETVARVASLPLAELEQQLQDKRMALDARRNQLAEIQTALDTILQRPGQIRSRQAELATQATELESRLAQMRRDTARGSAEEAALWLVSAQLASVNAERAALEEERLSRPERQELLTEQFELASLDVAALESQQRILAVRADELRQDRAAEAQATADMVLADMQDRHALVQQLADSNAALSRTFTERSNAIAKADKLESDTRSAVEQLETDLESIARRLELLGMNTAVGAILRERQAQLPQRSQITRRIADNSEAIRASSLRQVELEEERRALRNRTTYVNQLLVDVNEETAARIRDDLVKLTRARRDLVAEAMELENSYAQELEDLDFTLRRHAQVVEQYRRFILERLLWIPSHENLAAFQIADLVAQAREVFAPTRWLAILGNLPGETIRQPLTIAILLVVLILVYLDPRLKQRLADTGTQVGRVRSDTFASTLQALGLTVLLSLKWPLLVLVMARLFEMQSQDPRLASALYVSLVRTSLYFWGLEFLRLMLLPTGVAALHFRWPGSRVASVSRRIVMLERTFLPAAFLVGLLVNLYFREVGGLLGALVLILGLLALAHFFSRFPEFLHGKMELIIVNKRSGAPPLWSRLVRKLLVWVPIAASIAVVLGYSFTAIEMALQLVETFVVLSCILILHELGLRWLGLTRRRMALRLREEQAAVVGEEGEAGAEEDTLENAPELLSDQGTRLLNLLTIFGGLVGVLWIWADVFPALNILDSVKLWHQSTIVDGVETVEPVTLGAMVKAIALATVGWIVIRRVPALLELFLRQKVKLTPGSAYAAARVIQYAAVIVLIVVVFTSLGGRWSSMQWAVAALSLGIGFGLQEIVANFISGLIILFEQPIRVGDVVTVGQVTGTVTRIQMRATTIRDFDRRELLVPNKAFITTELLNWSLSDSVTRRLVQVGVAYGTDMDKALAIVGDVAAKHPKVMSDPAPVVTFDSFGDNSLLISLRYFIDDLSVMMRTDSELRLEINRRFLEADIVVAFPQRDIHVDTLAPLEIRVLKDAPGAAGDAPER